MRNLKIVVEYEGTNYHGWQRQKGLVTVQFALEESISRITGEKITVVGSGRTDTGVHALRQVAHFKTNSNIAGDRILLGMNSLLPHDIAVKEIEEMSEQFHARFDVKSKTYIYQICNKPVRPAILRKFSWHIRKQLNMAEMRKGLAALKGKHDFTSFCGKNDGSNPCIRTIMSAGLEKNEEGILILRIEADGFLRYMVRTIAGTIVEIGSGKKSPSDIPCILESRDRSRAGITAPAHGLFLYDVKY